MKTAKNILVITYWSLNDALIQSYTLPYLRIIRNILPEGSCIHLVTFEPNNITTGKYFLEKNILQHAFRQMPFGLKALIARIKTNHDLLKLIHKENIDTIHAWCTTAGAMGWRLSKQTGLPLIIDSYEPHAEAMTENGTWKKNGIAYRLLLYLEKKQTFHAKHLICAAPGMPEYARKTYGYTGTNFFIKPACVDPVLFNTEVRKDATLLRELGLAEKIVAVYAGKTGGIYLEEELFDLFRIAANYWGDRFRVLFLTSTPREKITALSRKAGINPAIIISRFVSHAEVPKWLGLGDFGLTPVKPVPTKKYCSPIKDGEYWAMGLPVIITAGISEDSEIISKNEAGYVLKDLSTQEMQHAVEKIDKLLKSKKPNELSSEIRRLALVHRNFKIAEDIYRKIYATCTKEEF